MFAVKGISLPAAFLLFVVVDSGFAQQPQTKPRASRPAAVTAVNVVQTAPPEPAPDPQPAIVPARVSLVDGQITVTAQNSDLAQILAEIGRITGMSVTGLNGGPRVFGVYGPADARTVLTTLLAASGYNFLLVGSDAVPRALVLTPETKAPPTVVKAQAPDTQDEYEQQYAEQDSADPY